MPEFAVKYRATFTGVVDIIAETQDQAEQMATEAARMDAWDRVGITGSLEDWNVIVVTKFQD